MVVKVGDVFYDSVYCVCEVIFVFVVYGDVNK